MVAVATATVPVSGGSAVRLEVADGPRCRRTTWQIYLHFQEKISFARSFRIQGAREARLAELGWLAAAQGLQSEAVKATDIDLTVYPNSTQQTETTTADWKLASS